MNEAVLPNPAEQVSYEAGLRPRYAGIAVVAGVLVVVSAAIQLSGPQPAVTELTVGLINIHQRFTRDLVGACLECGGLLTLAAMLTWLHEIARARNPSIGAFIRWLAIAGAVLDGAVAVADAVVLGLKANQFVAHGDQSYVQAKALVTGGLIQALPMIGLIGSLLLAAAFVWTALNAMRVGLLTRFMGYLGVFAGVLVLIPIGSPVPVVQGFWLLAMGVLLAGRWPNGTPPAWQSGVAVPWAPVSQPRERPVRGGGRPERPARRGRPAAPATPQATTAVADAPEETAGARTRASTPKRKRKRRR